MDNESLKIFQTWFSGRSRAPTCQIIAQIFWIKSESTHVCLSGNLSFIAQICDTLRVSSWIKHRSLRKLINLELYPIYWRTHSEMRLRRKMHYFVVFQPSKVEMPIFSASILINLTHFPRWLRKSAIKIKKNSENLSRMGASIRAKMHRLGMEGKSQIDSHLSHRKTKRYFTRWKVMCFCVIEFEKRSHRIAQDIFLFLLWTSDTLPVQSSCFAPEMISLLRKAKIIFQEPVVITATTSNKLDSGHSCYYIK